VQIVSEQKDAVIFEANLHLPEYEQVQQFILFFFSIGLGLRSIVHFTLSYLV